MTCKSCEASRLKDLKDNVQQRVLSLKREESRIALLRESKCPTRYLITECAKWDNQRSFLGHFLEDHGTELPRELYKEAYAVVLGIEV